MPSTYKLTYFDVRGYTEPARQLLHLAGVPFDDERIPNDDDALWEEKKKDTPFGQVSVLTIDGSFQIPQSAAIIRYLARKFGFAGATLEDQAWVDAIVDQFKDFYETFWPLFQAQREQKPADEIEKIRTEVALPARDKWFAILNGLLERSTSGWLIGDGLTFADVVIVDNLVTLEKNDVFVAAEHPRLAALRAKLYSEERLQKWLATRPDTKF